MGLILEFSEPCKSCSNNNNKTFCLPCDGYKKWTGKQQAAKAQAQYMSKKIVEWLEYEEPKQQEFDRQQTGLVMRPSWYLRKWLKKEGIEI